MRVFDRLLISTLFVLMMWTLVWVKTAKADHRNIEPQQQSLPIFCGDSEHLIDGIREKYSEEIIMMAPSQNQQGHDLFHSLWINAGTSTWSFVVVNREVGMACVIASGDQMKLFFPEGI